MSSPPNTHECNGDVLDMLDDEQGFSTCISPSSTDPYNSNVSSSSTDAYVPWFIDSENTERQNACGFNSANPQYQQWGISLDSQFLDTYPALAYQDTTKGLEIPPAFFSQPTSGSNSISDELSYTRLGQQTDPSLEQQILIEIAMPTNTRSVKVEANGDAAVTSDLPPSPKRRKSSASTSASSPTEDYRRGHNAIEKRYRSNLNAKIISLGKCLPIEEITEDEMNTGPPRSTKSSILTRAIQHIEFLKQNTTRLTTEAEDLNKRLRALEKMALGPVVEVVDVGSDCEAEEEGMFDFASFFGPAY